MIGGKNKRRPFDKIIECWACPGGFQGIAAPRLLPSIFRILRWLTMAYDVPASGLFCLKITR